MYSRTSKRAKHNRILSLYTNYKNRTLKNSDQLGLAPVPFLVKIRRNNTGAHPAEHRARTRLAGWTRTRTHWLCSSSTVLKKHADHVH
jgi:hypothetical protein